MRCCIAYKVRTEVQFIVVEGGSWNSPQLEINNYLYST